MIKLELLKRTERIVMQNARGFTPKEISINLDVPLALVYRTLKGIKKNKKPHGKLSEEDVKALIENVDNLSLRKLGEKYGISHEAIRNYIKRYKDKYIDLSSIEIINDPEQYHNGAESSQIITEDKQNY